jgi:hypothetical protein
MSAIEGYLRELRRRLGRDPLLRRRVLAEVEDHLREAAARDGEDAAIERFGPPEHLARELGVERASSAAVWAAGALVLAAGGFLAAYVVGENTLPPAPWPTEEATPGHLRWKVAAVEVVFAVAAAGAAVSFALAWTRRTLATLVVSSLAFLSFTTSVALVVVEAFQRAAIYNDLAVPGRPSGVAIVAGAVWLASLTAVAGGAVIWALRASLGARGGL